MMRNLLALLLWSGAFSTAAAAQVAAPAEIPKQLPAARQTELAGPRAELTKRRQELEADLAAHNARCSMVEAGTPLAEECRASQARLQGELRQYGDRVREFNAVVAHAASAAAFKDADAALDAAILAEAKARKAGDPAALAIAVRTREDAELAFQQVIREQNALFVRTASLLTRRWGWDSDAQTRTTSAVKNLPLQRKSWPSEEQVQAAWDAVDLRGSTEALAKEAAGGKGPDLPGAGTQTRFNDCVVFAVATATDRPYGVVAAGMTELLGRVPWRDPGEQRNPQRVIERQGLNGVELVLLAEALGQAEVVPETAFAKTLAEGRPIMVALDVPGSDVDHQVVLTKTFQRGTETWFSVIDSNEGPARRRYLSADELGTMLLSNGVAFRPEKDRTVRLLR